MAGRMSLYIFYISNFLLLLCLIASLMQSSKIINNKIFTRPGVIVLAYVQLISILLSFLILIYLFLISDFNFDLVYFNSHSEKPLIYKFSGVWGNHEGSMLLWILILVLFNFLFALSRRISERFKEITVAIQSIMIFGFVAFLFFLSNPFALNQNNFFDGIGLNPILQDPLLAIHPPVLYVGYVGFSLVFSLAIAGLITKEVDQQWATIVKPWVFSAWAFLTAGIALGSFWAYYELGWGGYWFWDPVENASLMPWIAATALIHCVLILQKRNVMQSWTIILAILTFSLSLVGTFLVRSGILNSVHTFASDPGRGLFILLFIFLILVFSFSLFAYNSEKINKINSMGLVSRGTGIQVNNWLLITILTIVFLGTMYPLATDLLLNKSLTVGPKYYSTTIAPIIILFLFFMFISPRLGWTDTKLYKIIIQLRYLIITSLTITLIISLYFELFNLTEILIIFFSLLLVISSVTASINFNKQNILVRTNLGQNLAHAGFGILMMAVVSNAVYSEERIYNAKVGDNLQLQKYIFSFDKIEQVEESNYNSLKAYFLMKKDGKLIDTFTPEIRFYSNPPTITSEASILHKFFSDIYLVMNVPQDQQSISVRMHIKPFMTILWLGTLMIIIGGIISASIRIGRVDEK